VNGPATLSAEEKRALNEADARLTEQILPRIRLVEWRPKPAHRGLALEAIKDYYCELLTETGANRVVIVFDRLQKIEIVPLRDPGDFSPEASKPIPRLSEPELDLARQELITAVHDRTRGNNTMERDPIIVVSEVCKGDYTRRRLTSGDIRGSGHLIYGADCVLLLERPPQGATSGSDQIPVLLNIERGTLGVIGSDLELTFSPATSRFGEAGGESRHQPDVEQHPGSDRPTSPASPRFKGRRLE
jgi:hypothetical protein